jgi:DNA repair protein RecN (Recombination protein N)
MKVVLANLKSMPCIMFDEIDTGISGKTSESVGLKLKQLSEHFQVIAITHQPQVASKADCHFKVEKDVNTFYTNVLKLEDPTLEIARLLSGKHITKEAVLNASSMLTI